MSFITDQSAFDHLCAHVLPACPYICIDTEFQRETTYYPRLSLVQMATPHALFMIDALVPLNWEPFKQAMQVFSGDLVFFSGRQDLEIFHHRLGFLPTRVFDVQMALEALGYPTSMGYGSAVSMILDEHIDKSQQHTDWLKRPLSPEQIKYASQDVMFLKPLYLKIKKDLEESLKLSWILEDMIFLTDPKIYEIDPMDAWKKSRLQAKSSLYLLRLQRLCAARESVAKTKDKPRQHIIKDVYMHDMALKGQVPKECPKSYKTLFEEELKLCQKISLKEAPFIKGTPVPILQNIKDQGLRIRHVIATHYQVHEQYLCTTSELNSVLRKEPEGRLMQGWRFECFTLPLLKILNRSPLVCDLQDSDIHSLFLEKNK